MITTIVKVEDRDKSIVTILQGGGLYIIENSGGATYNVIFDTYSPKSVEIDGDIKSIRYITRSSVVTHYVKVNSDEVLSVEDYLDQERKLLAYADVDGDFADIDREYDYKKFTRLWVPAVKVFESIGDPLNFAVIPTRFDTGSKYISSMYSYGGDPKVFKLDLYSLAMDTFLEKMNELEVTTTSTPVRYENADHSCIRFAKLSNTYIFDRDFDYDKNSTYKGTLEACKDLMNNIRKRIRDQIQVKYNILNPSAALVKGDLPFLSVNLLPKLESLQRNINNMTAVKDSKTDHAHSKTLINDSLNLIRKHILNEK
jgi:hypothetical protein